jgi:uncharacterized protein (TIGR02757 family)
MAIPEAELHEFLEFKYMQYDHGSFIENDPVSVPHLFRKRQDIEIAGFLSAVISWGNRRSIVTNARRLLSMMDDDPFEFIMHASDRELLSFERFVHRTFNGEDCIYFLSSLISIYSEHESMEELFLPLNSEGPQQAITGFRERFLFLPHPKHVEKHLPDPSKGSAAKRMNMFLRWMVRRDPRGVDFGIWRRISPSKLVCPLDVHSGNVARKLGLLRRKQNDWKAAEELTANLRRFDPQDPVKYDLALFGLGISREL